MLQDDTQGNCVSGKTLLIVDDEPLFTESLSDGLRSLDPTLRVVIAENGLVAKNALENESVDLVLTDLMMPVMDGWDLLSYLRQKAPNLPVLVVTAFGTPDVTERLRALGIGDVIEKPVDFGDLSTQIATLLESGGSTVLGRGQLAGHLRAFSPFEMVQLLCDMRKAGVLELRRIDGAVATCTLRDGGIAAAECGHLRGREAMLTLLWWKQGSFLFRDGETTSTDELLRVPEVLMQAVRLADETERRKGLVPRRDAALFLSPTAPVPEDDPGCDVGLLFEMLSTNPGLTCAELEGRLPLSPVKVRLGLALLAKAGDLIWPKASNETPAAGRTEGDTWWRALMERFPGGLRVLVVCGPSVAPDRIFAAVSKLGATLDLANPSVSFSPGGPSFVRLRPPSGGILSLTFLQMTKKHRYLFETFVRSVQVVLVCPEEGASDDIEDWTATIPSGVSRILLDRNALLEDEIAARLRALAEPPSYGETHVTHARYAKYATHATRGRTPGPHH
jgi:CheY-like chemotaxis protein